MKEDRILALAGLFQAAALVHRLANGAANDDEAAKTSIDSVFKIDAASAADVYGGSRGLKLGLKQFIAQLEQPGHDLAVARLVMAILRVERKLAQRRDLDTALGHGIEDIRRQLDHFGPLHPTVLTRLGELYANTLSTLRPRVLVHGNPQILADAAQAARIRALLLAGVRSAVLWRQLGGRQWQLLLQRGQHVMAARGLLSRATLDSGH